MTGQMAYLKFGRGLAPRFVIKDAYEILLSVLCLKNILVIVN